MLQAPTSETKADTAQSKSQVVPQPERELHPHGLSTAGPYSSSGMGGIASGASPEAQRSQAFAGMQSSRGNQAVLRMLHSPQQVARIAALRPSQGIMLQRKFACGGSSEMEGECAECKAKGEGTLRRKAANPTVSPAAGVIQRKLAINQPGDQYEQEADRVADQVLATPVYQAVSDAPPRIQRFPGKSNGPLEAAPASVDQALTSPGRPLEAALRKDMEQRFGHDFSKVRVHSGSVAEQSAQDVNAHAYTVGHNLVFGEGRFAPGTHEGRRLIAHELTHVVQQSGIDGIRADQGDEKRGLSSRTHNVQPLLQRDTAKTITKSLHPEETGIFFGSFKLPSGGGLLYYRVELNNVPPLMLNSKRAELDLECQLGIGKVLQELLKSKPLPSELPPLHLRLDAGNTKVLNEGYVESLVRRAAREEMNRLIAQSQKVKAAVLEAIVGIMSGNDVDPRFQYGPAGENLKSPLYYIQVKKSVTEKEYVDLLWRWFQITNETSTDKPDIQVKGSMARRYLRQAVAETAPIADDVQASGPDKATLISRYKAKIEEFTQRAAKEEVDEMIEVGEKKEREPRADRDAMTEEEKVNSAAIEASEMLDKSGELAHRLFESKTTSELGEKAREKFDEQLHEYLKKVFKEKEFVATPELVAPATRMNLADGITWLKGGLDAVSAILTVTDPKAREELFMAHTSYFGKTAQGLEILFKFVSGTIAFGGAGVYLAARILGKSDLAAQVLEVSTEGLGKVAGALFAVGLFKNLTVILDPDASPNEKVEAAIEAASNTVGLASFVSRWVPRLKFASRWSGPIAVSLAINFEIFKRASELERHFRVELKRLSWVPCYKALNTAAEEVQLWTKRLAVTDALMAYETDIPRQRELRKYADAYRFELLERDIKPFVESKTRLGKTNEDPDDCGPELTDRFKPLLPLLKSDVKTDDAALGAAAMFLHIVYTALVEWDKIVDAPPR